MIHLWKLPGQYIWPGIRLEEKSDIRLVVSPEEIVIRLSEIQELEDALGYLAKEEAELITLLFFEEFTVKETAQYFGCCPKTIRNRRKKVLEKLKEQLENT